MAEAILDVMFFFSMGFLSTWRAKRLRKKSVAGLASLSGGGVVCIRGGVRMSRKMRPLTPSMQSRRCENGRHDNTARSE